MKTALEILAEGTAKKKVPVLLIGGYALQAHGVVRQTMDVDCLIAESCSKDLEAVLLKAGYKVTAKTENFIRYVHPSDILEDIDILLVNQATFDEMLRMSGCLASGAVKWRVPSLPHFIALKLHAIKNNPSRETRDLADIVGLLKNSHDLSKDDLKSLCLKYGPQEVYSKLEKAIQ